MWQHNFYNYVAYTSPTHIYIIYNNYYMVAAMHYTWLLKLLLLNVHVLFAELLFFYTIISSFQVHAP